MTVEANCGHVVEDYDDLVLVIHSGEECDAVEGFVPAVYYLNYCPVCAEKAKLWPEYLVDHDAADRWLEAQRP